MRREGCRWALLFTTADGEPLYESTGWRTLPRPYRRVTLSGKGVSPPAEYFVYRYHPGHATEGWAALAAIYSAYNAARPLTIARDLPYWQGYAAQRFEMSQSGERAAVFVATGPAGSGEARGYVLAYAPAGAGQAASGGAGACSIAELGVLPGHEAAIPALLAAAAGAVGRPGWVGRIYLPREPAVDAVLDCVFDGVLAEGEDRKMMVLPLAPGCDHGTLAALVAQPGAVYWPLDEV
jgi:hypothetical protein